MPDWIKYMAHFHKNNNTGFPDALIKEAEGLSSLQHVIKQNNINIQIPQVHQVDEHILELEQINAMAGSSSQWHELGQGLAKLYQQHQKQCGWPHDNYIGLNPQHNDLFDDWGYFFWQYRLQFQVDMIRDVVIQSAFSNSLNQNKSLLIDFLNRQHNHHSLLHGDLWNGNVLFDAHNTWLIDPAVYCGDAEADVAMTELFGGFPATFYQGYQTIQPLSEDYPLKKVIYNLYHQLNHYNLFGSGYLAGCERGFRRIEEALRTQSF